METKIINMQQPESNLAQLQGGVHVVITFRDGSSEPILVRELPLREMQAYRQTLDDEEKSAELFCGKPAGWADTVTRSSLIEILNAGEDLNLAFFSGWLERANTRWLKIASKDKRGAALDDVRKAITSAMTPLIQESSAQQP